VHGADTVRHRHAALGTHSDIAGTMDKCATHSDHSKNQQRDSQQLHAEYHRIDHMSKRLILCDVDGVLLHWEVAFDRWMMRQGYQKQKENSYKVEEHYGLDKASCTLLIQIFNESAAMRYLTPIDGANNYMIKLHEDGYKIKLITSQTLEPMAHVARQDNLRDNFGNIFDNVIFLDTGSDKDEILSQMPKGSFWIEDKPENALAGAEAGMVSILFTQPHNKDFKHKDVTRCDTWKDIYQFISTYQN
jgi:FMN phosphatase YigB (HAD superfamily)